MPNGITDSDDKRDAEVADGLIEAASPSMSDTTHSRFDQLKKSNPDIIKAIAPLLEWFHNEDTALPIDEVGQAIDAYAERCDDVSRLRENVAQREAQLRAALEEVARLKNYGAELAAKCSRGDQDLITAATQHDVTKREVIQSWSLESAFTQREVQLGSSKKDCEDAYTAGRMAGLRDAARIANARHDEMKNATYNQGVLECVVFIEDECERAEADAAQKGSK